jgi:hypothetical protein
MEPAPGRPLHRAVRVLGMRSLGLAVEIARRFDEIAE